MTISEGAGHFLAMARTRADGDLCEDAVALLGIVGQAGLLIRHSGRLLVLPYQKRRWPVRYTTIEGVVIGQRARGGCSARSD
jgi:hypothetical protein